MTEQDDEVATRCCPACQQNVPAAPFCGNCGAAAAVTPTRLRILLRPRTYATAHREPVWMPRVSSTYLPRVPGPMRRPFRIGLIFVLIVVIVCAEVRLQGPGGVTATIGWPLLFLIYVWQTDVFRDIPVRIMLTAMALGVGLGVGWWLAAGKWLAGSYGVSTGSALSLTEVLNVGLAITAVGSILMLVPVAVCRLFPMRARESLDGFVIGAFGALWYSTAATTTIIAPQFAEGLIEDQTSARMLEDGISFGVVGPIVTTAAGGLAGLLLWFSPDRSRDRRGPAARKILGLCAVAGMALYMAAWMVDSLGLPAFTEMAVKLGIVVLALLLVRCAIQMALLHEQPDPWTGRPVLCAHCRTVVPDMPFCSSCGAATRASSRTSRRRLRESPPVPVPA